MKAAAKIKQLEAELAEAIETWSAREVQRNRVASQAAETIAKLKAEVDKANTRANTSRIEGNQLLAELAAVRRHRDLLADENDRLKAELAEAYEALKLKYVAAVSATG